MAHTNKAALILEGGGNRGVFTAGVLDYLMEQGERFPYVIGVSAGACNAMDYASWQIGRSKSCMIVTEKANRYVGTREGLKKGCLFDMDMVFERYPYEIFPFDFDTYFQSDIECEMVVTSALTGEAMYLKERESRERLLTIGRASSSIPLLSPMVEVDGVPCVDGGVADSVPLLRTMKKGWRRDVVVLTRNYGYRKKKPSRSTRALYRAALKKYPKLLDTLQNRYHIYNQTLELVEKWEKEGHIFVIRPELEVISRTETDVGKLTAFYDHGYELMEERFGAMTEYLHAQPGGNADA